MYLKLPIISFFIVAFFAQEKLFAQNRVTGVVTDQKGTPIEGANVYLSGTYDGASTKQDGSFSFATAEAGTQVLTVSFLAYETFTFMADVSEMKNLTIQLRDDLNSLGTVVISAGTFEAGDNSKVSVLKPLDIVTTASALGDFVGAIQTLPGTSTVSEDGRLFVRGGDATETQIFIDGLRVFTPYTPTANNVPTRGRYSPFLFEGITFSTGGYSAEFGQALSSVLLLNTIDEPDQEKTEIALMSLGGGLGNTQKWENSSLSFNASYINLAPYIALFPGRNDWVKPFETFSGETVFRRKFSNGLLKIYGAFDSSNFELIQKDINNPDGVGFKLKNNNLYSNVSYDGYLGKSWDIFVGGSYTLSKNKIGLDFNQIKNDQNSTHLKIKFKKHFNNHFKLTIGAEQFLTDFDENFQNETMNEAYGFQNNLTGIFAEGDFIFTKKFAMKLGLRSEYSALFEETTFSPRISVAHKIGKNSQVSLAYGSFQQQPEKDILKFESKLSSQSATHYILNYQYVANNRIFRAEAYRKDYSDLITYDTEFPGFDSDFDNTGNGFAQGIDLFWRDNETFKNLEYWVSYSFLDTERKFKNYPTSETPSFANTHNLAVVTKYWIDDLKSQLGLSYQFASGRTYTNPNKPGFLQEQTKAYNGISLSWAYLLSQQKILYFSVNNVLGFKNINAYQYADSPNPDGIFDRRELRPAADQFFFVGFFWTISDDKRDNQLDNL